MGHYLLSEKTGRFHYNPTIKRSTLLRDYERTTPIRPKIAGKRRRTWQKKAIRVLPPKKLYRVTVGTGVSVEGISYSLTYQEWVLAESDSLHDYDVRMAVERGEKWIRNVIVSGTGNRRYIDDASWAALDWGSTGGFNVGVDDTVGVLGQVFREGTGQSFIREGEKWKKSGDVRQLRFGEDGGLVR